MNKSILNSKTFWVQVIAILTALIPAVGAWIAANPVEFTAALGAVNILVRFLTHGTVTVFPGDTSSGEPGSGTGGSLILLVGASAALLMGPPACTPGSIPIDGCISTDYGTACYSSKAGISVTVDAQSHK